jgi:lipopolysaccharide biosynthesis glycosyltransferase
VAYHAFSQSIIDKASCPVAIHPLSLKSLQGHYEEIHVDGSNAFIYSRFLVPYLMRYKGWAIFADGDMTCLADIAELWKLRNAKYAAMVVKHDYQTKHKEKYLGTSMQTINSDYPRKNWSSVILWNCDHPANLKLTPKYVMDSGGATLHRFKHLKDEEIGELPKEWNWLPQEQGENPDAKLLHWTLGVPSIPAYKDSLYNEAWFSALERVNHVEI